MADSYKREKFTYLGAGFPVELTGFPFKKVHGVEVLDIETEKLDLAIARLVLLKPAFLVGKEIRFLRHFLGETLSIFGDHFDLSPAGIKKWEDLGDEPIGVATNDFSIRNYVAKRLSVQFEITVDLAVHKSILEAGQYWKPNEHMEIPFENLIKYTRSHIGAHKLSAKH